jgi:signal transduction histidine kinase
MEMLMARYRTLITYLAVYFFAIGATLRFLTLLRGHPSFGIVVGILAAFLLLLTVEPWLSRRSHRFTHGYLTVQTGLIAALSLITPNVDFFATLFLPLSLQAMHVFPPRTGFRWIAIFTVVMAILMILGPGWEAGLPLILIHAVAYFFVGAFVAVIRQTETARQEAEAARQESQALLTELQEAHHQLQAYAAQAEELAATKERNHLARELHDSVTQTIFSITLTAKSARMLLERDQAQAALQLDHLQELAQGALAEMRALIFELRPPAVEDEGLVPALRKHMAAVKSRDGLVVELHVQGSGIEQRLSGDQQRRLFRIVQEALNNVVKYAQTDQAVVTLTMEDGRLLLSIEDEGIGFDPAAIKPAQTRMGLASMRERAEMMGGTCEVDSRPGEGTRIRVEIPQTEGDEPDG